MLELDLRNTSFMSKIALSRGKDGNRYENHRKHLQGDLLFLFCDIRLNYNFLCPGLPVLTGQELLPDSICLLPQGPAPCGHRRLYRILHHF